MSGAETTAGAALAASRSRRDELTGGAGGGGKGTIAAAKTLRSGRMTLMASRRGVELSCCEKKSDYTSLSQGETGSRSYYRQQGDCQWSTSIILSASVAPKLPRRLASDL